MLSSFTPLHRMTIAAFTDVDTDYLIVRLYLAMYGEKDAPLTVRKMQQKIAPVFREMNRRMTVYEIVPGKLKQTYRLQKKAT